MYSNMSVYNKKLFTDKVPTCGSTGNQKTWGMDEYKNMKYTYTTHRHLIHNNNKLYASDFMYDTDTKKHTNSKYPRDNKNIYNK